MDDSAVQFEEFKTFCSGILKGDNVQFLKLIQKRYDNCKMEFRSSADMLTLLKRTREKLQYDEKRMFVHLKDFVTELKAWAHDLNGHIPLSRKRKSPHHLQSVAKVMKIDDSTSDSSDMEGKLHRAVGIMPLQHSLVVGCDNLCTPLQSPSSPKHAVSHSASFDIDNPPAEMTDLPQCENQKNHTFSVKIPTHKIDSICATGLKVDAIYELENIELDAHPESSGTCVSEQVFTTPSASNTTDSDLIETDNKISKGSIDHSGNKTSSDEAERVSFLKNIGLCPNDGSFSSGQHIGFNPRETISSPAAQKEVNHTDITNPSDTKAKNESGSHSAYDDLEWGLNEDDLSEAQSSYQQKPFDTFRVKSQSVQSSSKGRLTDGDLNTDFCGRVSPENVQEEAEENADDESQADTNNPKHSRHIQKLEKLLERIRDKIEEIRDKELSLDDLDADDSAYIYEDRLQKKFVKVWNKLCQLKGRSTSSGRPIERRFKFESTRFPEINRKIENFVNHRKIFPDFHDIKGIVKKVNTRSKLELSANQINNISREAFLDVGEALQMRRHEDFVSTFYCKQTVGFRSNQDPALFDPELENKLKENHRLGVLRLEEVINKYTDMQFSIGEEAQEVTERSDADGSDNSETEKNILEDKDKSLHVEEEKKKKDNTKTEQRKKTEVDKAKEKKEDNATAEEKNNTDDDKPEVKKKKDNEKVKWKKRKYNKKVEDKQMKDDEKVVENERTSLFTEESTSQEREESDDTNEEEKLNVRRITDEESVMVDDVELEVDRDEEWLGADGELLENMDIGNMHDPSKEGCAVVQDTVEKSAAPFKPEVHVLPHLSSIHAETDRNTTIETLNKPYLNHLTPWAVGDSVQSLTGDQQSKSKDNSDLGDESENYSVFKLSQRGCAPKRSSPFYHAFPLHPPLSGSQLTGARAMEDLRLPFQDRVHNSHSPVKINTSFIVPKHLTVHRPGINGRGKGRGGGYFYPGRSSSSLVTHKADDDVTVINISDEEDSGAFMKQDSRNCRLPSPPVADSFLVGKSKIDRHLGIVPKSEPIGGDPGDDSVIILSDSD